MAKKVNPVPTAADESFAASKVNVARLSAPPARFARRHFGLVLQPIKIYTPFNLKRPSANPSKVNQIGFSGESETIHRAP